MALATCCPHCHTTFRVVHDQLKLRSGMVRCGHCEQIFNGIEHLVRANSTLTTPAPPPATPAPSPAFEPPVPEQLIPESVPVPIQEPVSDAEAAFAHIDLFVDMALPPHEPSHEPSYEPSHEAIHEPPHEPSHPPASEIHYPAVSPPVVIPADRIEPRLDEPPTATEALPEFSSAEEDIDDDNNDDEDEDDQDDHSKKWGKGKKRRDNHAYEPNFVKAARRKQKYQRSLFILQSLACLLLSFGLVAQAAYAWRDLIAVRWPVSKPILSKACEFAKVLLPCMIELPTQISAISIELGELQALPNTNNHFTYTTSLRNHAAWAQGWPHIELVFLDTNERIIARRVFSAKDYLNTAAERENGFAAQTEQLVKLNFEILQLKAAGYRAEIFYP